MSMSPEQLSEERIFSAINSEQTEKNNDGAGMVDIEQMMTRVFVGGEKKRITSEENFNGSSLPIELIANPNETEKPPEEDDRTIRDKTGPSLRLRIDAGSPTAEKPPIYEVPTVETPIVADAAAVVDSDELKFNLQPENDLPAMPEEQVKESETPELSSEMEEPELKNHDQLEQTAETEVIAEENPVAAEKVKKEPAKEELTVEEDELSARRAARAQLEKVSRLARIDAQLLTAEARRAQLENLGNRNVA